MRLEIHSLNLPVAMQQQLKGQSPEKWVETIWQTAEKKEKRLLKLLTAVLECSDNNCAEDVALVAKQAFGKLEANKLALPQKKQADFELLSRTFKLPSNSEEKPHLEEKSEVKHAEAPAAAETMPKAQSEAEKNRAIFEWVYARVKESGQYKGNTMEEIFASVQQEKEEWAKGFS